MTVTTTKLYMIYMYLLNNYVTRTTKHDYCKNCMINIFLKKNSIWTKTTCLLNIFYANALLMYCKRMIMNEAVTMCKQLR